jgi:hypothetical protein
MRQVPAIDEHHLLLGAGSGPPTSPPGRCGRLVHSVTPRRRADCGVSLPCHRQTCGAAARRRRRRPLAVGAERASARQQPIDHVAAVLVRCVQPAGHRHRAVGGLVVHHRRPACRALIPSAIRRATSSIHGSTTGGSCSAFGFGAGLAARVGSKTGPPREPRTRERSSGFGPGAPRDGSAGFGLGDGSAGFGLGDGSAGFGLGDASAGFGLGDASAGFAGSGRGDAREGSAGGGPAGWDLRGGGPGGRVSNEDGGHPGLCQPSVGGVGLVVLAALRRDLGAGFSALIPLMIPRMISPPATPLATPIAIPAIALSTSELPSSAIRTA